MKQLSQGAAWQVDFCNKIRSLIITAIAPVKISHICAYLNLPYNKSTDRKVRLAIEHLVCKEKQAIASGDTGYFYIKTYKQLIDEKRRLSVPAKKMFARCNSLFENYYIAYPGRKPSANQLTFEMFLQEN